MAGDDLTPNRSAGNRVLPGYAASFEPAMRLALDLAAGIGVPPPAGPGGDKIPPPGRSEAEAQPAPGPGTARVEATPGRGEGEAQAATGRDADVPVGAVVLSATGAVLGQGRNACLATGDPTAHAEIVAIRAAARAAGSWRLDGCTLAVTLEPCTMCAGALISARIRRLVYGAPDPRAGAAGSLWDVVRDRRLGPPVEVLPGVLAAECGGLLSAFFSRLRSGTPRPPTP